MHQTDSTKNQVGFNVKLWSKIMAQSLNLDQQNPCFFGIYLVYIYIYDIYIYRYTGVIKLPIGGNQTATCQNCRKNKGYFNQHLVTYKIWIKVPLQTTQFTYVNRIYVHTSVHSVYTPTPILIQHHQSRDPQRSSGHSRRKRVT